MGRIHPYGEPKDTKESPITEFLGGFLIGGLGFPTQIGWVFPAWGLLSWPSVFIIGAGIGALIGGDLAWGSIKRKRQKGELCKTTKE